MAVVFVGNQLDWVLPMLIRRTYLVATTILRLTAAVDMQTILSIIKLDVIGCSHAVLELVEQSSRSDWFGPIGMLVFVALFSCIV